MAAASIPVIVPNVKGAVFFRDFCRFRFVAMHEHTILEEIRVSSRQVITQEIINTANLAPVSSDTRTGHMQPAMPPHPINTSRHPMLMW
jgi:hypothetical protein